MKTEILRGSDNRRNKYRFSSAWLPNMLSRGERKNPNVDAVGCKILFDNNKEQ